MTQRRIFTPLALWGKLLLALVFFLSILFLFPVNKADAAAPSSTVAAINKSAPIVAYATPSSGESKVYAYSDETLKTQLTSYYIDSYIDQIVIHRIDSKGRAVECTYPSKTSPTGYRTKWFSVDDILGINFFSDGGDWLHWARWKATTYRFLSPSAVTSNGYIDYDDQFLWVGEHKRCYNNRSYGCVIYPIPSKTIYRVSGVKHKLAFIPDPNIPLISD